MTSALPYAPSLSLLCHRVGPLHAAPREHQAGTQWEEVLRGCRVVLSLQQGEPQRDGDCRSKASKMPCAQPGWEHLGGVLRGLEGGYPPGFGCLRAVRGWHKGMGGGWGARRGRRVAQGDQRVTKGEGRVAHGDRRVVQEDRRGHCAEAPCCPGDARGHFGMSPPSTGREHP